MAALKPPAELQYQQLKLVLAAVGKSHWGKHLGLPTLQSKLPKKADDAHVAFVQDTDVMGHDQFVRTLRGILGVEDSPIGEPADAFLKPDVLTKEPLAGLCPRPFGEGLLPVTEAQVRLMKVRLAQEQQALAKRFKMKRANGMFYLYTNPLRHILGEALLPSCGVEVLLAEPEKKMFGGNAVAMPDPQALQAAGYSSQQRITSYVELLEKHGKHVEALYGNGRMLSDLALEFSHNMPHKRLIEFCPNLKYCFIDSSTISPNQAGYHDLFKNADIPTLGAFYSSFGLFGHAIDDTTPAYFEPVLDGGAFFEFVPLAGVDENTGALKPSHQRFWAGNLQNDQDYVLIVSSIAGLIAYNTGIVVRVRNIDPLRLRILGPVGYLNGLYERLSVDQTNEILGNFNTAIQRAYKCYVRDYMIGDHVDRGQAVWALEMSVEPKTIPPQVLKSLANRLHSEIAKVNKYYLKAFDQAGVVSPVMTFLPPGTFLQASNYPLPHIDHTPDAHQVRKLMNFGGERQIKLRVAKLNS